MQAQAYRGYFENGNFYSEGRAIRIPERQNVLLTILDKQPIPDDIVTAQTEEESLLNEIRGLRGIIRSDIDEEKELIQARSEKYEGLA
ncbi:MAG: hypothetical protein LBS21_13035 [Clostridiales bacterium]|jgi:hypothetical protein|nr:hypothetical protein [Clostridiales bacterium]